MKYNRIYIIGPVGSGKTTFSNKLSKKYNIEKYELDKVSWDDENGHVRRSTEEALKIFHNIINKKSWIIEDTGRDKFSEGRDKADIIYYIRLSRLKSYYRVTKRWIRQRLGKERYNHPPTIAQLFYFLSTVNKYYKKEKDKIKSLQVYSEKLVFVNKDKIDNILKGVI